MVIRRKMVHACILPLTHVLPFWHLISQRFLMKTWGQAPLILLRTWTCSSCCSLHLSQLTLEFTCNLPPVSQDKDPSNFTCRTKPYRPRPEFVTRTQGEQCREVCLDVGVEQISHRIIPQGGPKAPVVPVYGHLEVRGWL